MDTSVYFSYSLVRHSLGLSLSVLITSLAALQTAVIALIVYVISAIVNPLSASHRELIIINIKYRQESVNHVPSVYSLMSFK